MSTLLTIGEFSRATHLSIKALRHYHDVGLLEPVDIDPSSGYRFYATAQVPTAQVIRRLRDLDMPLDEVSAVLGASDLAARDQAILVHLGRMESQLEQTQATVASLRALLEGSQPSISVEYRSVAPMHAVAIRDAVSWDDTEAWLSEALEQLGHVLETGPAERAGPDSALYSAEFFEAHSGEVVAFVPITGEPAVAGGTELLDVPAAELAVAVHRGPFDELDRTYGALGAFVTERAVGADGPIREHYLVTEDHTDDPTKLVTEVGWPVTGAPGRRS